MAHHPSLGPLCPAGIRRLSVSGKRAPGRSRHCLPKLTAAETQNIMNEPTKLLKTKARHFEQRFEPTNILKTSKLASTTYHLTDKEGLWPISRRPSRVSAFFRRKLKRSEER